MLLLVGDYCCLVCVALFLGLLLVVISWWLCVVLLLRWVLLVVGCYCSQLVWVLRCVLFCWLLPVFVIFAGVVWLLWFFGFADAPAFVVAFAFKVLVLALLLLMLSVGGVVIVDFVGCWWGCLLLVRFAWVLWFVWLVVSFYLSCYALGF